MHFKQTINNACGYYGLLHAVCNGEARNHICKCDMGVAEVAMLSLAVPNTHLSRIVAGYQRALSTYSLISDPEIERMYHDVASDGQSRAPERGEEVNYHYTCFVKSQGHLVELDGDLDGPVDLGTLLDNEDVVSNSAIATIRRFMSDRRLDSIDFAMLALGRKSDA